MTSWSFEHSVEAGVEVDFAWRFGMAESHLAPGIPEGMRRLTEEMARAAGHRV